MEGLVSGDKAMLAQVSTMADDAASRSRRASGVGAAPARGAGRRSGRGQSMECCMRVGACGDAHGEYDLPRCAP
jgi:hypothetical protein